MFSRLLAILLLLILLPGCGETTAITSNLLSYRTADVYGQGGDATLEIGRTTEGTMTGTQLGILTPEGIAPIAASRDENGTVSVFLLGNSENPGDSGDNLPF